MAEEPSTTAVIADAFSDVHLATSPFVGAAVSIDGDAFHLKTSFEALETASRSVAAVASSPRWTSDQPDFESVLAEVARRRRDGLGGADPVLLDPVGERERFAAAAMGWSRTFENAARILTRAAAVPFIMGGALSADGPGHARLLVDFVRRQAGSLSQGAGVVASFGMVAAVAGGVFQGDVEMSRPAPAGIPERSADVRSPPSPEFLRVAEIGMLKAGADEAEVGRILEFVGGAPGRPSLPDECVDGGGMDCRFRAGGITIDLASGRYLLAGPDGVLAVDEGPDTLVIFDAELEELAGRAKILHVSDGPPEGRTMSGWLREGRDAPPTLAAAGPGPR